MELNELGEKEKIFLQALFEQTEGDLSRQASMYAVGERLDFDKETSLRTAEMLMGSAFVEIRSLSGAIGLTSAGLEAVEAVTGAAEASGGCCLRLCRSYLLDAASIRWVEQTVVDLKVHMGRGREDFDAIMELAADLKTIDAQLMSPRPKTAIVREILRSIQVQLEGGEPDFSEKIRAFVGE